MTVPLYQVDAFTDKPFTGNPAAVCLIPKPLDEPTMQAIAAEMNLSETAFVENLENAGVAENAKSPELGQSAGDSFSRRPDDFSRRVQGCSEPPGKDTRFGLRWFTPAAEVELCGHATLASAHVLWEAGYVSLDKPITFQTRFSGPLTCKRQADGFIEMTLPTDLPHPASLPAGLTQRLGLATERIRHVARGKYDLLLEVTDEDAVRQLEPDFTALAAYDVRGIAVTAAVQNPSSNAEIVSRFFAPRLRINEDPVTGSLHCLLGPYWSARLGQSTLTCEQASPRGGHLRVDVPTKPNACCVYLAGQAITVTEGRLVV